jgi:CHAD domain-containing protein
VKRLEEHTQSEVKSLINHLRDYGRHGRPDALHEIRVDIKRIKAIFAALNGCLKRFKAHKNFIPFRNIFRKAGSIREPDLIARMLRQYKVDEAVGDLIPGNVERSAAAFKSDVPGYIDVVKKHAKKLSVLSRQVDHDDFKSYLANRKKEVKSQLYPRPKMAIIHKVRKGIKELMYLSELEEDVKKREVKFYDNMQDVIGQLHDKQVLIDLLKNRSARNHRAQVSSLNSECFSEKQEISRLASDYYKK